MSVLGHDDDDVNTMCEKIEEMTLQRHNEWGYGRDLECVCGVCVDTPCDMQVQTTAVCFKTNHSNGFYLQWSARAVSRHTSEIPNFNALLCCVGTGASRCAHPGTEELAVLFTHEQ